MPTMQSPSSSFITRTPRAVRESSRISVSWKRMAMPCLVATIKSSLPLVMRTQLRLSPSSRSMAIRPPFRAVL